MLLTFYYSRHVIGYELFFIANIQAITLPAQRL